MTDVLLWGDGSEILWGDGETMGEGEFSSLSAGTTWNPDDAEAGGVTFSNGDLTAARSGDVGGTYSSGRATTSRSSGKRYFEITADNIVSAVDFAFGVATSAANVATYLGQAATSWGYYSDGSVFTSDAVLTTISGYPEGGVVGCAIDLDAGRGWFCDETGSYGAGSPAAGTGAHFTFTPSTALFAAYTLFQSGGVNLDQITGNFGATAFAHTVPSGFLGWDEEAVAATSSPTLTYGAAPRALYERKVRAFWEEREELERQRQAAEQEQRARDERMRELQRQQAELDERRRTESRKSAVAKRRAKLAREIAEIDAANAAARAEIAALVAQINAAIAAQEMQADRRRRMVLLLAAAA